MSTQSRIEWTEQTWNPTVGCAKVSPGCKHCYAETMARAPQHTFQVLTKRAERMAEFCRGVEVPDDVWLGVSVENRKHGVPRIAVLRTIQAKVRFLSVEPLLEDLGAIDLGEIHWVIVGGESGHKARPMRKEWVDGVKRQCDQAEVAFFFKQWGAWGADGQKRSKKANGRTYRGRIFDSTPPALSPHAA